jgi:small subunit ribosomal protein S14
MAKQGMIQREKKRELLTLKYITKRNLLKNELKTASTYSEKLEVYKKLQKLPKNSAPVRKRNRCWATGRSRAFYRDFGLSRHVLREMAHEGLIPGLRKASW